MHLFRQLRLPRSRVGHLFGSGNDVELSRNQEHDLVEGLSCETVCSQQGDVGILRLSEHRFNGIFDNYLRMALPLPAKDGKDTLANPVGMHIAYPADLHTLFR